MPIMTGLEAALKLRQMHELSEMNLPKDLKLILVTGDEIDGRHAEKEF